MALQCHVMGVPMYVARDALIYHRYRKRFPFKVPHKEIECSAIVVHNLLFEPATLEKQNPRFRRRYPKAYQRAMELLKRPQLRAFRDHVQANRVRNDHEVYQIIRRGDFSADAERIEQYVQQCLRCRYCTTEKLDQSAEVPALVRGAGNLIHGVLGRLGVKALRCTKCGCFVRLKRPLFLMRDCKHFEAKP